jgi:uncharacterized circularly permuted ATP-grasp superfamily protein
VSYAAEDIAEAKQHIAETFSENEQRALKQFADMMRRPMNRKQRRILASRARRAGR